MYIKKHKFLNFNALYTALNKTTKSIPIHEDYPLKLYLPKIKSVKFIKNINPSIITKYYIIVNYTPYITICKY